MELYNYYIDNNIQRGDIVENAFKVRVMQTKEQEQMLNKIYVSCRFVYNHYLGKKLTSTKLNKNFCLILKMNMNSLKK